VIVGPSRLPIAKSPHFFTMLSKFSVGRLYFPTQITNCSSFFNALRSSSLTVSPQSLQHVLYRVASLCPLFSTSFSESVLHEGEAKKQPFIEPLSHKSEVVKEGEHGDYKDITRVRQLIFDVLKVLEEQNFGKKTLEPDEVTGQIILLVKNLDPSLSRKIIIETLKKTLTNNDSVMLSFHKLTGGHIATDTWGREGD